ncbi:MFS transporter [Actinacidiphila reveromycinica]|nr:MFS transporter [Streptomyces sp. SN-593]
MVLLALCLAQLTAALDSTIVEVALPSMRQALELSPAALQWVVNGYTLSFAGLLLLGGRLADVVGHKRIFLAGLGLFTLAGLAGGLAPDASALVLARVVQGAGAALLSPATMSLLTSAYPEPHRRRRALGAWTAAASSGSALGTVLGGVLTQWLSWHWVLWVNVPIGVICFAIAARVCTAPESAGRGLERLDLSGSLTVSLGLAAVVYAVVGTDTTPWRSARTVGVLASGITLLVAFVVIEARSAHPLLPLSLLRIRAVACANGQALLLGAGISTMFYFLSLYLQTVRGLSPLSAGAAFLPGSLGMVAGSTLGTRLFPVVSARRLLAGAGVLAFTGVLWLSRLPVHGSLPVDVLIPLVLACTGVGMGFVPVTTASMHGVAPSGLGVATGLLRTSQQAGSAIGLAALATVATVTTAHLADARRQSALVGGYRATLHWTAVLVLVEIGVVLVMPRLDSPAPLEDDSSQTANSSSA